MQEGYYETSESLFRQKKQLFSSCIGHDHVPKTSDGLLFVGLKEGLVWEETEVCKLWTNSAFTNLEFGIVFFQFGLQLRCCSELIVFYNCANIMTFLGSQFLRTTR